MKKFALEVEQLSVYYNESPVLWDIDLQIPAQCLAGIIGPNGAGKSTLFKAALGLVRPASGRICFFGKPFRKVRKKVAYIPQRSSIDWDFPINVIDLVLMGRYGALGILKRPKLADREAARDVLDVVGMLPFAQRQIKELSGGQQQRIFIARALLQEADIYLMDEPFAGIDVATETEMIALFRKLQKKGKTLLIVHHNLSTAQSYFDWAVMLNTCVVANGPIRDVFSEEIITRTFGCSSSLLNEAAKLSFHKHQGMQ